MKTKAKHQGAEFTRWMGPLLDSLRELGGSARPREASDRIAAALKLQQGGRHRSEPGRCAPPLELVDGETLVELSERVGLGVKPRTVFDVDYGFFEQFRS